MAEPQPLFDYTGHLPECPTWSEAEQALYWADIMECEIHRYDVQKGEHQVLQFPEEPGCFALREKGGFIVALRSGIWLTDAHGLLQRKVCDNPSNPQLARFNDGGTDRDGRFYAGTFWGPGDFNGALLVRIDNDLSPQVIQCDIHGANGLAFSEDKRWMYTSDTPNAVIYRTPLDERGEAGKREVFLRFQPGEGIPDGAAIDAEGCYWSAMFDGWRIARFSPTGEQLEEHRLHYHHAGEYGCRRSGEISAFRRDLHPASCRGRDEEIAVYRTLNRVDRYHVFAGIAAQHFH